MRTPQPPTGNASDPFGWMKHTSWPAALYKKTKTKEGKRRSDAGSDSAVTAEYALNTRTSTAYAQALRCDKQNAPLFELLQE